MTNPPHHRLFPSYRLVITVIFFGSAFLMMANFTSLNFTIACMVNDTAYADSTSTGNNHTCASTLNKSASNHSQTSSKGYNGDLLWSRSDQSMVLAANAIGAIAVVFIAGFFIDRYGARNVGFLAGLIFTVTSLTIPIATKAGWQIVTVVRVVQGFGVIAGWPLYLTVATKWFPIEERGLLTAIGTSGNQIGSIFGNLFASYCCKTKIGWPLYFYTLGGLNFIFLLAWPLFYHDDVESVRFISKSEINYIIISRAKTGRSKQLDVSSNASQTDLNTSDGQQAAQKSTVRTPWGQIAKSLVIWSIMIVAVCNYYQSYTIADYMPTYYKESLGIAVAESGMFSSLPAVVQFIGRISAGPIGDRLDRWLGRTPTIKIMTAISGYGPAVMLVVATLFDCHRPYGAVICLSAASFLFGYSIAGFTRAAMMVAPAFVGMISGMFQTANIAAALAVPYLSGFLIGQGSDHQWHMAFYVAAGIGAFGTTIFMVFGSGETQSWAVIESVKVDHFSENKQLPSCENETNGTVIPSGKSPSFDKKY